MLTEILNGFFTAYFNQPNKKFESEYVGTAMQLYEDAVFPSLTKELSYRAHAAGGRWKRHNTMCTKRDIETSQDMWHVHRNLNGIKKDFSENGREIFVPKCAIQRLEEARNTSTNGRLGREPASSSPGHLDTKFGRHARPEVQLHDLLIREPAKTNSRLDFTEPDKKTFAK